MDQERGAYGRCLETPEPLRTLARRSVDTARRSGSRTRRDGSRNHSGSVSRHRSRSPVRANTSRRSRSRTRRENMKGASQPHAQRASRRRSRSSNRSIRRRSPSPRPERRSGSSAAARRGSRHREEEYAAPKEKRSRTPSYSLNDVIKIVNSVKSGLTLQPSTSAATLPKNIDHKNILLTFDPSTKNQRIDIWLRKVKECAHVYGWDDHTTIHFAMQKLQGLAKVWYEGLNTILYILEEWQEKLTSAFPLRSKLWPSPGENA